MRSLNLSMLCLVLVSCAVDERDEGAPAVAERQDALTAPPTSLTNYRWGTPLFPSTVKSAYVVVVQHPTDSARFVAWGFDLVTGRTHFFVSGNTRSELPQAITQINQDISIPTQFDNQFTFVIAQQVGKKGPGQPPQPGNDWTAFNAYGQNIAVKLQAAQLQSF